MFCLVLSFFLVERISANKNTEPTTATMKINYIKGLISSVHLEGPSSRVRNEEKKNLKFEKGKKQNIFSPSISIRV